MHMKFKLFAIFFTHFKEFFTLTLTFGKFVIIILRSYTAILKIAEVKSSTHMKFTQEEYVVKCK